MENTLRKALADRKISGNQVAYSMESISHATFFKYLDDPNKYTFEQLVEMAGIIDVKVEVLLNDLGLIKAPSSYDLDKDVYVYA